jgi:hypothetical protein
VSLERDPLNLVSTIEELLGRNSSGSGLENREYGRGIRCADHATPSIRKKLALTPPTRGGRSVGIVCLRTKATEFVLLCSENIENSPFLYSQFVSNWIDWLDWNGNTRAESSIDLAGHLKLKRVYSS